MGEHGAEFVACWLDDEDEFWFGLAVSGGTPKGCSAINELTCTLFRRGLTELIGANKSAKMKQKVRIFEYKNTRG